MSKIFTITEGLENMGALRTGGQGSVYKGRRTGAIISAVKVLPTPIHTESADDKNYRQFLSEVEKLKKVNEDPNPNVVKILNSGITESGSLPFIEMEFIEGPDLGELLTPPHPKIFTLKESIKLADQLACALAHCHKVGVKHGDIKSNNVKFNIHSGNYVLLDFGLSIMSDEERRSSMRHAGAIEFMAPEQNEGRMLFQTDIYSYGVVLYELLTGQVPFPLQDSGETSRNAVMIAHMESPVPDLLALRKANLAKTWSATQQQREMQVPSWLLNLVYKCLEKLPENRYKNGMELHEVIIQNSVSANIADNNFFVLKADNEALQTELAQMQEMVILHKKNNVTVPKTLFRTAIAALAILLVFSGYAMLSKKQTYITQFTNKPAYVPILLRPYTPPGKPVPTVKTPVNDSLTNAAKAVAMAKKKHHRKKFLGLF
jgi:serine/threonine protein kinase